jgi:hypothetical protein
MIGPGFLSPADRLELDACVRRQREDHGKSRRDISVSCIWTTTLSMAGIKVFCKMVGMPWLLIFVLYCPIFPFGNDPYST